MAQWKSELAVVAITALAVLAIALGPGPAAQAPPLNLSGTWSGTGHDFFMKNGAPDGMTVTWVLTQTGSTVSGTVKTGALNPDDGSCSSCHRDKTGTVSGTISGTALTLTMDFPGNNGEVTSACTATFNGTAATVANDAFTTSYTGVDSCESPSFQAIAFDNGTLDMVRDGVLAAGFSTIRAVHITQLRARIDAVRAPLRGAFPYTSSITTGSVIRAVDITEMQTALKEAYSDRGLPPPPFATSPAPGAAIVVADITSLRAAVEGLE